MTGKHYLFTVWSIFFIFCVFAPLSAQQYSVYVRTGSTGILTEAPDDDEVSFGGAYALFNGTVTFPHFTVVAQTRFKLIAASSWDEAGTTSVWEKAYVAFDLPALPSLRIYGGKSYPLALDGCFFPLLEEYSAGARWGKDGLGFEISRNGISYGASLTSSTTSAAFSDRLQFGSGVQFDLTRYEVPLSIGFCGLYDSTGDGDNTASGIRDCTGAVFAQYRIFSGLTMSAGYIINGVPLVANSSYKRVANYSAAELKHAHLITFISSIKKDALVIEEESEAGCSFDGNYIPFYGAVRVKFPLAGIIQAYPAVQYFAAWNSADHEKGRDSIVLYPRITGTSGHHTLSAGVEFEYRETSDDVHRWGWDIPFYYKYTL
jgi:hypothetical protein